MTGIDDFFKVTIGVKKTASLRTRLQKMRNAGDNP
jgi:hypothetical protein